MKKLFALPLAQTPLGMRTLPFFNIFQPSSSFKSGGEQRGRQLRAGGRVPAPGAHRGHDGHSPGPSDSL